MNRIIEWFAGHRVAPNLLMVLLVVGGWMTAFGLPKLSENMPEGLTQPGIKQEVFPEFSLDTINITVPYLGAAPEEVEQGVCTRIEEAVDGLDGIEKITSNAAEGLCTVSVQLTLDADDERVLDEVKSRIDAIDTFPEETEQPVVAEVTNRRQVIDVAVTGYADDKTLRRLAEQVRDDLTALPAITVVELAAAPPYEIAIEVSEETLRRHGLTLELVTQAVRRGSLDLPGGSVRSSGGEILLRTKGQAYDREAFEQIVVLTQPDGTELRVADIATVIDGFAETDQFARFDGDPTVLVNVFRVGEEDALSISAAVKAYIDEAAGNMPAGISLDVWNDSAKVLRDRRDLLLRNAGTGLALVFVTLALFLRLRLAFWTTIGLFIAFMATFWVMPIIGVSINLISLFAFILVLGIVVDDAIVVGESIYTEQKRLANGPKGSTSGAQLVARPVVFAVLTTVAAFTPLLNVEGTTGKVMSVIPAIVIPCLLWSLVESLWILPAHLAHYTPRKREGLWGRFQTFFADGLERLILKLYKPAVEFALKWRYVSLSLGVATLMVTLSLVSGGFIRFEFFPNVESDYISVAVTMPPGTTAERTGEAMLHLERAALEVREDVEGETGMDHFSHFVSSIGEQPFLMIQNQNAGGLVGREVFSNLGELTIELVGAESRTVGSEELVSLWRQQAGTVPDAIEVTFTSSLFSPGNDIDVQLIGTSLEQITEGAQRLKQRLTEFNGVYDISDSFREGKRELKLDIKPEAEIAGLTLADLGRQVRQAFYGEEAQRVQRGRDDIRVMVRYPREERETLASLEDMRIRTPDGLEIPFSEVAAVDRGRGYAAIKRVDRRQVVNVTADVDIQQATAGEVIAALKSDVLPELMQDLPGLRYSFEGQQEEQRKTVAGLVRGFIIALMAIYALLAIPLRSYFQPLVIMLAIPFGLVGAAWGHLIAGYNLTILSMFGIVALTGVVVNDSLVMVDFINRHRAATSDLLTGVRNAGVARFRPILLTSLTTFAGLSPLMLEKSMQARFLIPMAISLAFGVLFSTVITLVLVPAGYMVMVDIDERVRRLRGGGRSDQADDDHPSGVEMADVRPSAPAARGQLPTTDTPG